MIMHLHYWHFQFFFPANTLSDEEKKGEKRIIQMLHLHISLIKIVVECRRCTTHRVNLESSCIWLWYKTFHNPTFFLKKLNTINSSKCRKICLRAIHEKPFSFARKPVKRKSRRFLFKMAMCTQLQTIFLFGYIFSRLFEWKALTIF